MCYFSFSLQVFVKNCWKHKSVILDCQNQNPTYKTLLILHIRKAGDAQYQKEIHYAEIAWNASQHIESASHIPKQTFQNLHF